MHREKQLDRPNPAEARKTSTAGPLEAVDHPQLGSDAWVRNLIDYRHFTGTLRRAPRLRSDNPFEKRLAAFAAKQRFAYRDGRLSPDRIAPLERLEFWTWGSALPRS
jgi:hypothetical protein